MIRLVLTPVRPGSLAGPVNAWLEAAGAERLEEGSFALDLSNADIAASVEVETGRDESALGSVRIAFGSGGIPYGNALGSELRRFCEELCSRFELRIVAGTETLDARSFFDAGGA